MALWVRIYAALAGLDVDHSTLMRLLMRKLCILMRMVVLCTVDLPGIAHVAHVL